MTVTVSTLQKLKDEHKKFATITAYDASFARIFDDHQGRIQHSGGYH